MRKRQIVLLAAFFLLLLSAPAQADILHLKTGHSLEGRVVEENNNGVIFEIEGGKVEFTHAEIARIERKELSQTQAEVTEKFAPSGKKSSWKKKFENWKTQFSEWQTELSGQTKGARGRGKRKEHPPVWIMALMLIAGTLIEFAGTAWVMKFYFMIFGHHSTFFEMFWFQVKLLFVGTIVSCIVAFGFGFVMSIFSGGVFQMNFFMQVLLFVIPYTVVYYHLANQDLDAGFLEAMPLAAIIGISYMIIEITLTKAGMVFPGSLIYEMTQAMG
ncbi:MAG: hypothetical protein JW893_03940 [Candidatus Omnitrophica bacterium]|nr:hypothetical protein [Candidatus Omnitrophota bacterium]